MTRENAAMEERYGCSSVDRFFNIGASEINESLRQVGCCNDFFFIDFKRCILRELLPGNLLKSLKERNVIIIHDKDLMPLALYYLNRCESVIAIFEKNIPVSAIVDSLRAWKCGEFIIRAKSLEFSSLTSEEMMIFDLHSSEDFCALKSDVIDMSKYYRYTRDIAKKLRRRKFSRVFHAH